MLQGSKVNRDQLNSLVQALKEVTKGAKAEDKYTFNIMLQFNAPVENLDGSELPAVVESLEQVLLGLARWNVLDLRLVLEPRHESLLDYRAKVQQTFQALAPAPANEEKK